MKRYLIVNIVLMLFLSNSYSQTRPGSALSLDGFKFEKRIKGPKHKNSKILEVMVDDNDYYFVVTYKGPKSFLTLIIYELYTWNIKGTYKFKSRAELYNSYFKEDGSTFYLNTDIYKQKFTEIDLNTGEMKVLECSETPKGCIYIEPRKYETDGYSVGQIFYFTMDDNRKNDIKVYMNKDMIVANDYLEDDFYEDEVVEEKKEKEPEPEKEVEKIEIKEKEIYLTQLEIEDIKNGKSIIRNGVNIQLHTEINTKFNNKVEGDTRYVLLTLIDLSKLSFGNKVTINKVNMYLKN